MGRTHELKCWPEPYQAVIDGRKRHEIRVDDRGFAVGDVLNLSEWDPTPSTWGWGAAQAGYTKRTVSARVTYISSGGSWGLPQRMCVMTIELIDGSACG